MLLILKYTKHKTRSLSLSGEKFYCVILSQSSGSRLGEPGWLLSVLFNDPLALVLFRWCLVHNTTASTIGALKRASLLSYLLSDCYSLLTRILTAIAMEGTLLSQMTPFCTNVYFILTKAYENFFPIPVNFNATSVFKSCY